MCAVLPKEEEIKITYIINCSCSLRYDADVDADADGDVDVDVDVEKKDVVFDVDVDDKNFDDIDEVAFTLTSSLCCFSSASSSSIKHINVS